MQEKQHFLRFLKDNIYLLVAAALLFTISFVIDNYWSANANINSVENKFQNYIQKHENDFAQLKKDTALLQDVFTHHLPEEKLNALIDKAYFIFFYKKDSAQENVLVQWNTAHILPKDKLLQESKATGFSKLANGYYVWNKTSTDSTMILALIPVKWEYIVTNDYLKNNYLIGDKWEQRYRIIERKNISSLDGTPLFGLEEILTTRIYQNNNMSVVFRLLSVLLVFIFIHFCCMHFLRHNFAPYKVFLFLLICLIGMRLLSYFMPFPLNFRQFQMFDPAIYGSDKILRSLGDLLINAVLLLWFISFVRIQVHKRNLVLRFNHEMQRWIALIVGVLIILMVTFVSRYIISSLVADSSISFDVINFFSLNIYSVVGFLVLTCIAMAYYFLCQILVLLLKPHFSAGFKELYLAVTIIGLLMLSFLFQKVEAGFEIIILFWLLIYLFVLNYQKLNLLVSRFITSKMVFWLFFFSVSITGIIMLENDEKEIRQRQHFAETLATKADPANETLLNSMLTDFNANYLYNNFHQLNNAFRSRYFKDSLINSNFSGYTNRYDTKVFVFDSEENPLYNREPAEYNRLNTILNTQSKTTGIPGLFYYDESYDKFSYISKRIIKSPKDSIVGYVFVLATPKSSEGQTLYPELFNKGDDNSIENSSTYAFAIYNNGLLINRHNDYPFATKIDDTAVTLYQFLMKKNNNDTEMWYNAGNGKQVVIVKSNNWFIETITLFSYLFCSFLVLTALFSLLTILMRSRLNPYKLTHYFQLSIRNQIHGTIIFFSILSFLVIGIATILFFVNKYESNNREKLSTTIQIMENEVKSSLSSGWLLSDSLEVYPESNNRNLEEIIRKISEIHGVDVNLYDSAGDLKVSSLALPYLKGILSTRMEPRAFYNLKDAMYVQYFQKEHVGELNFLSNYIPVIDSVGNGYAYLNIPYFTSQRKLKQEISNFLVTIINLNAFIFLIAGIVALFITNRITNSFSVIGEKMKDINIGQQNEMIIWDRDDEIGTLVHEFNKMVNKLDESAEALAKSEREGAWREMARQVAHEIKNPLTPMKLSMQFLQRAINNNSPNVKELTDSVSNTLIEQIDHLSKIASEFSQFANIETTRHENMDIQVVLEQIKALYGGMENADFVWNLLQHPVYIYADKTQINRLFTNLILNGLQSVEADKKVSIHINELLTADKVIITVTDNGMGIPPEIQKKIFTPNFTTKTSGTGLGLAMCKRIVEKTNGNIYFETTANAGTSFYVELPLHNA